MISDKYLKYTIWTPFAYSVLLSLLQLFSGNNGATPAFYTGLPLCFFFISALQMTLFHKLTVLNKKLDRELSMSKGVDSKKVGRVNQ